MGKKELTAHFFAMEKLVGADLVFLQREELELALDAISEFKLDRNEEFSRFFFDGTDERCLMFQSDREDIPKPSRDTYVPGLFIKRRTSNYPYENNDTGELFQIQLSSEENELAEVTFFIIDTSLRVLMFISNQYVGSVSSFESYINNRLKEYDANIKPLPFFIDESFVKFDFAPIKNETPEEDFNLMANIGILEMNIAGSLRLMESILETKKDDDLQTTLSSLAQFSQKARAQTVKLVLSSSHGAEKLDKQIIKNIFNKMRYFFQKSEKNDKFMVKGRINDEVRYLDLLNPNYFHKTSFAYDGKYIPINGVFKRLYPIMDTYRSVFIEKNKFEENGK